MDKKDKEEEGELQGLIEEKNVYIPLQYSLSQRNFVFLRHDNITSQSPLQSLSVSD